jgi:hypothetical protein
MLSNKTAAFILVRPVIFLPTYSVLTLEMLTNVFSFF